MGLTKANLYKKPEHIITTSWDDGGILDEKIAMLLSRYNLPGTFYVVVDMVGMQGYMDWEMIKQLDREGFSIGSHTMSHPSDLKTLYDEDLHYQIQNSKDMIESVLGHPISSFCYPRGRVDDRVREQVIKAGYAEARITGKPGVIIKPDPYLLPGTIHIFQRPEYGKTSIFDFATQTLDRLVKEGGYCNIWGHSAEIERDRNWDVLERVLQYASRL